MIALVGAVIAMVLADQHLPRRDARRDGLALVTAALAGGLALSVASGDELLGLRMVLLVLAAAAVVDARTLRLPNELSLLASMCAVIGWLAEGAHLAPLIAGAAVGLFMLVAYLAGGAGAGDVKMIPPLALAATAPIAGVVETTLMVAGLMMVVFTLAMALHVLAGAGRREHTPLGPPLLLGGFGALAALSLL